MCVISFASYPLSAADISTSVMCVFMFGKGRVSGQDPRPQCAPVTVTLQPFPDTEVKGHTVLLHIQVGPSVIRTLMHFTQTPLGVGDILVDKINW